MHFGSLIDLPPRGTRSKCRSIEGHGQAPGHDQAGHGRASAQVDSDNVYGSGHLHRWASIQLHPSHFPTWKELLPAGRSVVTVWAASWAVWVHRILAHRLLKLNLGTHGSKLMPGEMCRRSLYLTGAREKERSRNSHVYLISCILGVFVSCLCHMNVAM